MPETPPDHVARFRERAPRPVICSRDCRYAIETPPVPTPWWATTGTLVAAVLGGIALGFSSALLLLGA